MIISEPQITNNGSKIRTYNSEHLTNVEFMQVMQGQFISLGQENTALKNLSKESREELVVIIDTVKKIAKGDLNSAFNTVQQLMTETRTRAVNFYAVGLNPFVEKLTIFIPDLESDILTNPELKAEIVEALDSHGKEA